MGIFSSIFGRKKDSLNNNVDDNPWAGLSSYEDPEKAEREGRKPKLFCGRDEESHNVAQLIAGNIFVTLYGKSGTGKTSLLNAGVFPRLRQKRYLPLSIRLSMDAMDISFQKCIIHQLTQAIHNKQGTLETINVIALPEDELQPDYLWSFFAKSRFLDSDGRILFPVIVFDQFEEVFRDRRYEAEVLLRQIAYMMDESHALSSRIVDGQPYKYDFNFRFVASIREDDLYRLEDSIDNCYLPELKRCRYRLRSLSEQGAKDVILIPGEVFFKTEEQKDITDKIIDKSRNEDGSISTNIISLLCSRIFVDFKRSGNANIALSLVESFLKGNPFECFYCEATQGLPNREKSYIEDHFIDSSGRRNSISENDFLIHVKNGAKLLDGNSRILQRISTSSDGGNYRVELIHDFFCDPIMRLKEERERRKRIRWFATTTSIMLLCISVLAYILYQMQKIRSQEGTIAQQEENLKAKNDQLISKNLQLGKEKAMALLAYQERGRALSQADSLNHALIIERDNVLRINQRMEYNQSLAIAEKVSALVDEGDSYTARLLALSALPKDLNHPNRSYTIEAEIALRKASQHQSAVLRGHQDYLSSVAYSPDGLRIVSASWDNTIRIWDASTGQCLLTLKGHTSSVNSANFSLDGQRIVSASWDKTIRIWDALTGKCIKIIKGHELRVNSASFSSDGMQIVSTSDDKTIRIWDASTGQCIQTMKEHTLPVNSAVFNPDGKQIVSASNDKTIRIWDTLTGRCLLTIKEHNRNVNSVAFSPDGRHIISASSDSTARIWNATSGQCVMILEGFMSPVYSAVFSPDGKHIVSASEDKNIRIWNVSTGQCIQNLKGSAGYFRMASFSPDGRCVASSSSDNTIRIWDISIEQSHKTLEGHTLAVTFVAFSPDGQRVVSTSSDKTIRIWNTSSWECLQILEGHLETVWSATFSPDNKRIISASSDNTIRIWDAFTGQCIQTLKGHKNAVWSAYFSPNGRSIVSASDDNTIRVWDASTGECILVLKGHRSSVKSAVFSNDSLRIISASIDGTIRIWDATTGQCLLVLKGKDQFFSAVPSPNGRDIVSASLNNAIGIWDMYTGQCFQTLYGHAEGVLSAVFSPDGQHIVSTSMDNYIRIWDISTGKCLQTMVGHTGIVCSAAFSPDGGQIVSASADKTIRIWNVPPLQKLIDDTYERFKNRLLTPEERRKYYLE